ncbi:hypothetical protein DNC80_14290 [Flavobacterium sp. SOK18b]|nr:hypothetical protein [Flavobacterium sp. SOK18b]
MASLCCTFNWKTIVHLYKKAKIIGQNKKDKIDFIKRQEKKGLKPFSFGKNSNTVVYAQNGNRAILDYKNLQNNKNSVSKNKSKF